MQSIKSKINWENTQNNMQLLKLRLLENWSKMFISSARRELWNSCVRNEAVYRTAPATRGLLNICRDRLCQKRHRLMCKYLYKKTETVAVQDTVRSLAPICSSTTSTMFLESFFRQTHTARQRLINRNGYYVGLLCKRWLLLEWQTRVSGGQADMYAWSHLLDIQ